MSFDQERQKVVNEALSWLGTPYHHAGRVKGSGVDCFTLVVAAYQDSGMIEKRPTPKYAQTWHVHRNEELYLKGVLEYCDEITDRAPLPGDLVLWKFGRCFAHGTVVIEWPLIIHAWLDLKVLRENITNAKHLTHIGEDRSNSLRPMKLFTLKRWNK